ncbi:hypothetical protein ACEPAF_1479 [Sanghuangporus sanghuang]
MSNILGSAIHIALLVAATTAHTISSTPPRIAQESSDHLLRSQEKEKNAAQCPAGKGVLHGPVLFNRIGLLGVASTRYAAASITVLEVVARLLSVFPSSLPSRAILPILLPSPASGDSLISAPEWPQKLLTDIFSPIFLLAVFSIFVGFTIRRRCFAEMGRFFSFTHTTLEGHQLVRSGPYGVVRHPSYTGEVFVRGGMILLLLAPTGYARSCGALQAYQMVTSDELAGALQAILFASVRVAVTFYVTWISFNSSYLIWRAPKEDASLREAFGKQWEEYAKEVPYRFIPYIA